MPFALKWASGARETRIAGYWKTMSEENIELVTRCYEALAADDLDEFLSFFDPHVEFRSLILEIEGTFHGREGVRTWWNGLKSVFPNWNPSLVEVRDLDPCVVARARGTGSGVASGVGLDDEFWQVVEIRNRKIVWYRAVRTEREALEAAGRLK
jgi:ketosteroid isomerase-like protein